ncbi:MAG: flagellar hook-length control protein FliK [Rubrivivax sp.]
MIVDTLPPAPAAATPPDAPVRPAAAPVTPVQAEPAAVALPAWNDSLLAAALAPTLAADTPAAAEGAEAAQDDPADGADAVPADWAGALQVDVLATLWRAVQVPNATPDAAPVATNTASTGSPAPAVAVSAPAAATLPVVAAPAALATPMPAAGAAALPDAQTPAPATAVADTARAPAAVAAPARSSDAAPAPEVADVSTLAAQAPAAGRSPAPAVDATPALKLPAARDAWNQPLVQALGDRLRLQLGQGVEQATIRLDPPELGSIEIVVRREAGVVHVQLSASHPDVQRQLQQLGEPLRQELAQRQGAEASVEVARHGADADGRGAREQAQREAEVGRALAEAGDEDAAPFTFPTRTAA